MAAVLQGIDDHDELPDGPDSEPCRYHRLPFDRRPVDVGPGPLDPHGGAVEQPDHQAGTALANQLE